MTENGDPVDRSERSDSGCTLGGSARSSRRGSDRSQEVLVPANRAYERHRQIARILAVGPMGMWHALEGEVSLPRFEPHMRLARIQDDASLEDVESLVLLAARGAETSRRCGSSLRARRDSRASPCLHAWSRPSREVGSDSIGAAAVIGYLRSLDRRFHSAACRARASPGGRATGRSKCDYPYSRLLHTGRLPGADGARTFDPRRRAEALEDRASLLEERLGLPRPALGSQPFRVLQADDGQIDGLSISSQIAAAPINPALAVAASPRSAARRPLNSAPIARRIGVISPGGSSSTIARSSSIFASSPRTNAASSAAMIALSQARSEARPGGEGLLSRGQRLAGSSVHQEDLRLECPQSGTCLDLVHVDVTERRDASGDLRALSPAQKDPGGDPHGQSLASLCASSVRASSHSPSAKSMPQRQPPNQDSLCRSHLPRQLHPLTAKHKCLAVTCPR